MMDKAAEMQINAWFLDPDLLLQQIFLSVLNKLAKQSQMQL
jgi:hypothetical protein